MRFDKVIMNTYNEKDFIEYAIKSVKPFAHKFIIVDGRDRRFPQVAGCDHSSDGTLSIVRSILKPFRRTIYESQRPWQTFAHQRDFLMNYLDVGDKVLMLDGDEAYHPKSLKKLLKLLDTYQYVRIPYHHFFVDFWHTLKGVGWDGCQVRAFVYHPDMRFLNHGYISFGGRDISRMSRKDQKIHGIKPYVCRNIHFYNYGGVLKERSGIVSTYRFKRNFKHIPDVMAGLAMKVEGWHNPDWWLGKLDNVRVGRVRRFSKEHPEVMKKHPLYNRRVLK